jgi:hypothetical protein
MNLEYFFHTSRPILFPFSAPRKESLYARCGSPNSNPPMADIPSPPFCKLASACPVPPHNRTRPPTPQNNNDYFYAVTQVLFMSWSYARAQFFHPIAKCILAPANLSGPRSYVSLPRCLSGTTETIASPGS